jgi:NAD+ synthase (glutamine-hydrolysing)
MRIAIAQLRNVVGAAAEVAQRICDLSNDYAGQVDALVFPELTLAGYPPEDLLLRQGFLEQCEAARQSLLAAALPTPVIFGHPERSDDGQLYNAATWINADGAAHYAKRELPNYAVFDEKRYFSAGSRTCVRSLGTIRAGVLICEDAWLERPAIDALEEGAQLLIVINASPWHQGKLDTRIAAMRERVEQTGLPLIYVHWTGAQDDLVFDGQSFALNADGSLAALAPAFTEGVYVLEFDSASVRFVDPAWHQEPASDQLELVWAALVTGLHEYVVKNRFPGVLLGLSGGIDSALTVALAVDALGPDRVRAYMLPSRYTSQLSLDGAVDQARALGVAYADLSIEPGFQAVLATLAPEFVGKPEDVTEENLQSRLRGVLLMALSNKLGLMLMSTGNKSEMAVGYATIYGDMCGGYAPLKDVYKTQVFELARWRNTQSAYPVIPPAVIERPPSAELRDNQTDQDSLPEYATLDAILVRFIEHERSFDEIVADGFDPVVVQRVIGMVLRNEHKRHQSAPGPRVTSRAFGRDRRYPITSAYR